MRAVNLIPLEERRARSGAGRSGGAVYGVLGALAVALLLLTVHTTTKASIAGKQAELAQAKADTAAAQRLVDDLQAYTTFASLREKRVSTVTQLATSRFDWAAALREVARTTPQGTWLTGLRASVNPQVAVEGGTSDPLRSGLANPAIELAGCSTGQQAVARLVADLRRIDGVERVSLSSSAKDAITSAGGAADGAAAEAGQPTPGTVIDPCSEPGRPKFSLTAFFRQPAVAAPAAASATTVSTATPTP